MGTRNQVSIGFLYRPASPCSLSTQFQIRFLESIPRPIAGLKFPTLNSNPESCRSKQACYQLSHQSPIMYDKYSCFSKL